MRTWPEQAQRVRGDTEPGIDGRLRRPKHERRTARALHAEIKAACHGGGYSAVIDFARAWRQGEGQSVAVQPKLP